MSKGAIETRVFVDGKQGPLAIHPMAIGVAYPKRETRDRKTYELREMVTSDVADVVRGVAVLSIEGPLNHKSGWWGASYESIAKDFALICSDPAICAIVLKFDSPGGDVSGLNETVAILRDMKRESGKPVIGYVDEACYSAAYALAMACDEIYVPPSGGVGSIGVITCMMDQTARDKKDGVRVEIISSGERKADGHPHIELTDDAIERTQSTVDKLALKFFELVASSRPLTIADVEDFQAGTFLGQDAVDAGLADGVMSLQECLTLASDVHNYSSEFTKSKDGKNMGRLAAEKALRDAKKALLAAKGAGQSALAAARVLSAERELAKIKKTKTTTVDTHEEIVDDGEPDEDDAPEEDGDSEDAEDESAEDAKAIAAMVRKFTGRKTTAEISGVMQAFRDSHRKVEALSAEVASLKKARHAGELSAIVDAGIKAGKLTPGQQKWAMSQSVESIKAYLEVATVQGGEPESPDAKAAGPTVTPEMAKIWKKQGFTEADFPKLLETLNAPKKGA